MCSPSLMQGGTARQCSSTNLAESINSCFSIGEHHRFTISYNAHTYSHHLLNQDILNAFNQCYYSVGMPAMGSLIYPYENNWQRQAG